MDAVVRAKDDVDDSVGRLPAHVTNRHAPCNLLWAHRVADTQEPQLCIRVIVPLALCELYIQELPDTLGKHIEPLLKENHVHEAGCCRGNLGTRDVARTG